MTDYTPGPWEYDPDDDEIRAVDGSVLFDGHNNTESDAILAAAAPDLLAALEDMLLEVFAADENEDGERICAVCQRPDYLDCNPNESCGRARAAIARARREN